MERRMALLKHTKPAETNSAQLNTPVVTPDSKKPTSTGKGIKRKHSLEPQSLVKKFATIARNEYQRDRARNQQHRDCVKSEPRDRCSSTSVHNGNKADRLGRLRETPSRPHRDSQSELDETSSQSSKHSQHSHKQNRTKDNNAKNKTKITLRTPSKRQRPNRRRRRWIPKDEKIMRTDVLYYVPRDEIVPMDISPRKKEAENVSVPSFRIKVVPRGYTMEGTENLGDEIYLKRHQKPENEEKRRKRWDLQRIREQKAMDKLHQSRLYRNTGCSEEEEFETFLPDPDKVEYLEICEEIPVSAFGFPLPKLNKQEFDVPWFDVMKRQREERPKVRSRKR